MFTLIRATLAYVLRDKDELTSVLILMFFGLMADAFILFEVTGG